MSTLPPPEDRLTQQERANFLEEFIREVTAEMDALMDGHNFEKEIKALRFRQALLKQAGAAGFEERVRLLEEEVRRVEQEYAAIRPRLDALEEERRFYRSQTSGY